MHDERVYGNVLTITIQPRGQLAVLTDRDGTTRTVSVWDIVHVDTDAVARRPGLSATFPGAGSSPAGGM
jgi:hypothetical protein